ncbi:MAG TPA: PIG-L family deacetylase [Gaiellaceae bacterium]|nr:PIG-L family deacetylase [Gaiellaceae bacterium]
MAATQPALSRGKRVVVVSPHLDDGVLSLGASMASWARCGAVVQLLTVLACDPSSEAAAGGWDRRGGFETEGESARVRREEDRRACALVGATPVWLPFGSVDYDRHGDEADVRDAVLGALDGADSVIVPGLPLTHPDHLWLAELLAGALGHHWGARYAEQPYTRRAGVDPEAAGFARTSVGLRDRVAKWRAIRCYDSQLPLLAMRRSPRRGPHRYAVTPEWVAWGRD